jgi:hypothetical protein
LEHVLVPVQLAAVHAGIQVWLPQSPGEQTKPV